MVDDRPSLATLEKLATSPDVRDRAFAASSLALLAHALDPRHLRVIHDRIRDTAARQHADVREHIRSRTLDMHAFIAQVQQAPLDVRDHLLEEILGIAYPGLDAADGNEVIGYCPSGLAEISFMLEQAELDASKTFVDLGSGLGKVVLLVALLTGARAYGIEANPELVSMARAAARALDVHEAEFLEADLRSARLPHADVYYMFIPSMRSMDIVARLAEIAKDRRILLFAAKLDLDRLPWLRARNRSSYWLETYEGSSAPAKNQGGLDERA